MSQCVSSFDLLAGPKMGTDASVVFTTKTTTTTTKKTLA
jgi:hypothetical protein